MNYRDAYTRLARMITNNVPRPQVVKYLNRCELELSKSKRLTLSDDDAAKARRVLAAVAEIYSSIHPDVRGRKARRGRIVAVCALFALGLSKAKMHQAPRWNERNIYKLLGDAKQSDHMVAKMVLDDIEGDL